MLLSSPRVRTALVFIGSALLLSVPRANADITNFSGFSPINLRGNNAINDPTLGYSGDFTSFKLTSNQNDQATSGFFATPQDITGFTLSFNYQSNPGFDGNGNVAADGIALIFLNSATGSTTALGDGGGSRGYGGITTPSAALQFDVFGGFYNFGGATGFQLNGVNGTPNRLSNVNLSQNYPVLVSLTYSGTTLTQTVTNPSTQASDVFTYTGIDLSSTLGTSTAYLGFSGATGGYNAAQTISNFSYVETVPEPATGLTLLSGAGWLAGMRRRRRLAGC